MEKKASAEKAVREIRRKTRRRFSAEEKIRIVIEGLRGEVALFWCPEARNPEKRWSDDPLRQEWNRACKCVGVRISLYEGTKHTTATALAEGGIEPLVLKALGGWKDSKSVERYARPKATRAAIVRALPGRSGTPLEPRRVDTEKRRRTSGCYGGADGTRTRKAAERPPLFPGPWLDSCARNLVPGWYLGTRFTGSACVDAPSTRSRMYATVALADGVRSTPRW